MRSAASLLSYSFLKVDGKNNFLRIFFLFLDRCWVSSAILWGEGLTTISSFWCRTFVRIHFLNLWSLFKAIHRFRNQCVLSKYCIFRFTRIWLADEKTANCTVFRQLDPSTSVNSVFNLNALFSKAVHFIKSEWVLL